MINTFSLKEIAEKSNGEMIIEIPSLQRGLVWSPRQVEFLWDSILRDFPIGGFVLSPNDRNTYDLMDGQQRFNSIQHGFNEPSVESKVILWLDINPKKVKGSTRKYYVKATTLSHPWGYKNNDDCSTLSAGERREALKLYFKNSEKNIYKEKISILETFPYESREGFPIPLSFFTNDETKGPVEFYNSLLNKIQILPEIWKNQFLTETNLEFLKTNIEKYKLLFDKLRKEYAVPFSKLPRETLDQETDTEKLIEEQSDLEILFNRLNTGGTRISQADLTYSAIKAYWGSINKKTETLAYGLMPPAKLVMLLFRLYLTLSNSDTEKFESQLSIKKIRSLAFNQAERVKIESFFNEAADSIISKVKNELNEIPSFVQMRILTTKPDIFLLLFYLSAKGFNLHSLNAKGLALLLFWFCNDVSNANNTILKKIKNLNDENVLLALKKSICELTGNEIITLIYTPDEIKQAFLNSEGLLKIDYKKEPEFKFIRKLLPMKTVLLYAQRKYLEDVFPNYKPADLISWEDHNRPWDYDHIMPKDWSYNRARSPLKSRVDFWRDTIANFAAIPFEVNRAKSNTENYEYYKNHKDELYFDDKYLSLNNNITNNAEMVSLFENLSFNRLMMIWKESYQAFSNLLIYEEPERVQLLKHIVSEFGEKAKIYFISDSLEYEVIRNKDYLHIWLSVEIELSNTCMLSFTWCQSPTYKQFEFGLRKHISLSKVDKNTYETNKILFDELSKDFNLEIVNQDWWYLYSNKITPETAVDKLKVIFNKIDGRMK